MQDLEKALKRIFDGVVGHALSVEARGGKLSPAFFIDGSQQDTALKAHYRLLEQDQGYKDSYETYRTQRNALEKDMQSSWRLKILLALTSPAFAMTVAPIVFPFVDSRLNSHQDKLFEVFSKTPEAARLRAPNI